MKRMFDFKCKNANCSELDISVEYFIKTEDQPVCHVCARPLVKQISTTNFKIEGEGAYNPGISYK